MKATVVLEIPVFGAYDQYFDQFDESKGRIIEKKYHDFVLKEYVVDDDHTIYLYFMNYIPEMSNISLVNQIIPKAPFAFFLLDPKEGLQNEVTRDLFAEYNKKYSTPGFVVIKKDPLEFYEKIENDPLIKANNFDIILVEENIEQITKTVIVEAIKRVAPVNI